MIRIVVTFLDGTIGARTVAAPANIPFAIGGILERHQGDVTRFRLRILEVEPDDLPADPHVEARAHAIARRLVAKAGQKLIAFGTEG